MENIKTHRSINQDLCGNPIQLTAGYAEIEMKASAEMAVDEKQLVHGGFVFGLADHAAMIAVNDPNVVLGAAQCMFKKPVKVGDTIVAKATVSNSKNNKRFVYVAVLKGDEEVFQGEFTCFILDKHVLD